MRTNQAIALVLICVVDWPAYVCCEPIAAPTAQLQTSITPLPDVDEARARAILLHETIHATLQIVHHRYFREDEGIPIPATTLKQVFGELATRRNVQMRWLAVETPAMNIDHQPQDEFERNAVKSMLAGNERFEVVEDSIYRHAAAITLKSECLKCHLPNRKSTEPRTAGLTISIHIRKEGIDN